MKIAIASSGLGHATRGIESWARDTAAALHARGLTVTLFKGDGNRQVEYEVPLRCLSRNSRLAQRLVRWSPRFGWRVGLGSPYQLEQTTFVLKLLLHLRREKPDLVHLQDPWAAWILERLRKWHRSRVIYMNGTDEPLEFIQQFQFLQEQSPSYLARHQPEAGRYRFHIPSFVDTQRFSPGDRNAARAVLGIPADAFVVLSVGALRRTHKRMDWLVQEFAAVNAPTARLLIAGAREPESEALLREARSQLADRVMILENVSRTQMPGLYNAADVFVLCSLREIFGLGFLEAMACGVPCIGHHYPVTEWIIGEGGEVIDMQRKSELSHAIDRFAHADYRRPRAALARQRVLTVFAQEVVIDQMLVMYRAVLERSRRQGVTF